MPHNETPHRGTHGRPTLGRRAGRPEGGQAEDRAAGAGHVRRRRTMQIVETFDALARQAAAMGPGAEVEVTHRVRADGTVYQMHGGKS